MTGTPLANRAAPHRDAANECSRTHDARSLQSNVRTTFNLYRNLADSAASDPTNDDLWSDRYVLEQTVADQVYGMVMAGDDMESSYQLAVAYNTLISVGTGTLKIKGV